jgi:ribonuclease HI
MTLHCITINTDASFHPVHQKGGYAFYIISDLFKIQKGGMFKHEPKTPQEAEEMCIGNAIATLLAQSELPTCKLLIINSDCKYAFNAIKNPSGIKQTTARKVYELLHELVEKLGNPEYQFRHVKAHTNITDKRTWVNDWCDKEAKKWMRLAVKNTNNKPAIAHYDFDLKTTIVE